MSETPPVTAPASALALALRRENGDRPPVWMMRQAGRYHSHYQMLKRHADFIQLCKDPALSAETAMGPVHDFNFDAAILFSDLLFPLEAMGMGLRYDPGPRLDFHLRSPADVARLQGGAQLAARLQFQADAVRLTRARLRNDKALIGFVGGPFTLYVYAAAGSHENATQALSGLQDGTYPAFNEKLLDLLAANMALQSRAGADCVALFDTAAGEIDAATYGKFVVPVLADLLARFRRLDPDTPVTYYSRGTGPEYWDQLSGLPIQCLGVDWRHPLPEVLARYADRWAIQGNVDPEWLHLPGPELEQRLREYFTAIRELPADLRRGWVCGLGHGILQKTPEDNVRRFVALQREIFG
jgi:uroporphyrinogen decarboxylase